MQNANSIRVQNALPYQKSWTEQESTRLYAEIVKNMPVRLTVFHLKDPYDLGTFTIIYSNPAAGQGSPVSVETFYGKTIAQSFPRLLEIDIPMILQEVLLSGKTRDLGEIPYGDEHVPESIFSCKAFPLPNRCVGVVYENVTERKKAEETIAGQGRLLDLASDAIIVRDLNGKITYWNKGAERMYGWTAKEALGETAAALLRTVYPVPLEQIKEVLFRDGHWEGDLVHSKHDGTRVIVASRWTLQRDNNGTPQGWLQVSRDITEQKKAEEALRLLVEVAAAASSAEDTQKALSLCLTKICNLKGWQVGQAWLPDAQDDVLVCATQPFYANLDVTEFRKASLETRFKKGAGLPGRVWESHTPAWVVDVTSDGNFPRAKSALQAGLRAAFAFPIKVGQELLAVLEFFSREIRKPDPQFLDAVKELGSQLGDVFGRKRGAEELRQSEEHYRSIIETANDAFVGMDSRGLITDWNRQAEITFGWSRAEIIGRTLAETIIPPRHREAHIKGLQHFLPTGEGPILNKRIEVTALHHDGHEFPIELTVWPIRAAEGWRFNAFVRDVTERKRAARAVQEAEELERRTTELTLLSQLGSLLHTCLTAEEAYGIIAQFAQKLFPTESGALCVLSASRHLVEAAASWGDAVAGDQVFAPDDCWALRSGHIHFVEDPKSAMVCRHVTHDEAPFYLCVPMVAQGDALGVLHLRGKRQGQSQPEAPQGRPSCQQLALTVAEQIGLALANLKLRNSLRTLSVRDPLTGLFNRRYMEESLERELRRANRRSGPLGTILLDVDDFKRRNDTLGHEAGDNLLLELGNFLRAHVRGDDIACRYGGDEFTLILPDASLEISRQRAEQVREGVKHLGVHHRGQPLGTVTLSLGVAVYPEHGITAQALLRSADSALYEAKKEGRDRVVVGRKFEDEDTRMGSSLLTHGERPNSG